MQILTELRRYASIGWQHRWKALALAWLVCVGGWAYVSTIPDQYRASTRIYADADAVLSQLLRGIAVDGSPTSQVELLQRTLLSRPNLERVATRTGLDLTVSTAAGRDAMLEELGRQVRIALQGRSLFTISYTDENPRLARDVVQAFLTLFMEQASANDRQQMENARNFVNQQVAAYESQLREAEQRRAEFRTRYLELLPNETDGGFSRLERARSRLQNLRGELQDAGVRRDVLRQQLETTPATLAPEFSGGGGGGGGGDGRLAEAERQLRELRLQFTDQHPSVIAARNTVAELRANPPPAAPRPGAAPRPAASQRPNQIYEQLRVRLLDSETQIASLERQTREEEAEVTRLEALARTVPQVQAQFLNLDRDYAALRRAYEELLERRESVGIAGAARTGADRVRLEVVDPPLLPNTPVGPNRLILASAVLAAGLGAGVALAFLFVQLDRSFYTVHDLRKLGLPVLGGISSTELPQRGYVGLAAFAGIGGLLILAYGVVVVGGPRLMARLPDLVGRILA